MAEPAYGSQLQKFFCALHWVKTGIPGFSRLVEPLHLFIEKLYARAGTRKKLRIARIALSTVGWGATERHAFIDCIYALSTFVTLAHRDTSKRLCVYTDASETFCSGIMTQLPGSDASLAHE